MRGIVSMRQYSTRVSRRSAARRKAVAAALFLAGIAVVPPAALADASNPVCPAETVFFDPGHGQDIVVPSGFEVSVFAKGLNFPTAVAFRGDGRRFEVFVLESGHGLPSRCNDETSALVGGELSATNPFTPDILVFDQSGNRIRGPLAKPTTSGVGLQPHGPAIDIAFEKGFEGGRLFATDSNQAIRAVGAQNNSSRIVTVNPETGHVTPFIAGLPTGDHPAEQITFKDGWIYWSQGSTTNSSVVGHDNGGGANQQDIPCQDITLSQNTFDSGDGHKTSGYSPHGVARPGATVRAFESATGRGICDGSGLRAKVNATNPKSTIEPFSWGYRNPYGIRVCGVDFRSQDRAVADSSPGRALERPHSRARPGDAMGRVPAGLVAITGVKRVLAQRNVLTRDVLLVSATTVVVTDYAGVGRRPLRPVNPAVFEGDLLRRVVSRGQTGDKRGEVPGLGVHGHDARAVVLRA